MKKIVDDEGREATYSLLSVFIMRALQLLMTFTAANYMMIIYFCSLVDAWKCTFFDRGLTAIDLFKDPCCNDEGQYVAEQCDLSIGIYNFSNFFNQSYIA